jgi:hypothetical protein
VDKLGKWMAGHPDVLPALAAVITGLTVWQAYKYGTAVGWYRTLLGEQARAASEALGG